MKLRLFFIMSLFCGIFNLMALDHYYCTPADEKHFHLLKNLIGSIHHNDFEHLKEIAVFNLGFTTQQISELRRMQKVKVYDVEMTHPNLLKPLLTSPGGRKVRGFFAWKPVIIKQALEMFPYVLYMDAGTTVLKPLEALFEYIKEHGYFLLSCTDNDSCKLGNRITRPVCDKILTHFSPEKQKMLLTQVPCIDAGLQGLSRSVFLSYVLPIYEHTRDLTLFADDGSAKLGYGEARHDQTLFTIYAYTLGFKIHPEGRTVLDVDGKFISIHTHWDGGMVCDETIIYRSRGDINFRGGMTKYIKFINSK